MRSKSSEARPDRRLPQPGTRRPRSAPPLDPGDALDAALQQVLRDRAWGNDALSPDEARRLAGDLLVFLERGETPTGATYDGGERTLVARLVDLTRKELLTGGYGVRPGEMLRLVRSLEHARDHYAPAQHQLLAAKLTGANALDLVVELAHDLRSPLTSIMFLSETLRKGQSGEINEVQRKQLGIVYSAALGLVSVASDVVDLAREKEAGHEVSLPSSFSLSELVDSVRLMVAPMAEEKKLDLTFLTPDHDVRIGLAVPLSRVLLNLTTNAIKFTEQGTVEIVVKETARQRVEVSVRDTGRGMDEEALAAMYEPFRRNRSSTGFHFSGTGLGLALSRRMVEILGGELNVESKVNEGSRFHFEIELPRGSRV